jgi:adenosylcobinamide kinase/adenosylcobinamide-phosphate guanylyltransferase
VINHPEIPTHQHNSSTPQVVLVLGGARSGKSAFAEQLVLHSKRPIAFIATATASDEDMTDRITRHRTARPPEWHTIEEPLDLAHAVQQAAQVADILLLDCMTLWLSNWLMTHGTLDLAQESTQETHYSPQLLTDLEQILHTFAQQDSSKRLVIVSNEVGLGIVPEYALGRTYRDLLGRINQRLAAAASHVYLMIAGLAVDIKHLHTHATLD